MIPSRRGCVLSRGLIGPRLEGDTVVVLHCLWLGMDWFLLWLEVDWFLLWLEVDWHPLQVDLFPLSLQMD